MTSIESTLETTSRRPSRSPFFGAVAALSFALTGPAASAHPFPKTIALPDGFQPEGIAVGRGHTFFVGSIPTGAIVQGDLRTGETFELVPASDPQAPRSATGMKVHHDVLFVAGGPTGQAYAFDVDTGDLLEVFNLAQAPSFVNDVVVTEDAAFFTDSFKNQIYRVPLEAKDEFGPPETIPLTGDMIFQPGTFNVNGIDATPNGKTLIVVQSSTGFLFTVDPETGVTERIALGGQTVQNGDGILLDGRRLWVVQNRDELLTLIRLSPDLSSGRVEGRFTDETFDIPTTVARFGNRLVLVNARFGVPSPETAEYWLTQIPRPR